MEEFEQNCENTARKEREKGIRELTFELSRPVTHPGSTLGININGRPDFGILFGKSKLFNEISQEEFANLFSNVFKYNKERNAPVLTSVRNAHHYLLDENNTALRELAQRLGVPVKVSYKENPHYKGKNAEDKEIIFNPEMNKE